MRKSYRYPQQVRLGVSPVRPAPPATEPARRPSHFRGRWLLLLASLLLLLAAPLWLQFFGTFLVASDEPTQAEAIIVLGGNAPDRLPRALDLWRQGYAPLLIV